MTDWCPYSVSAPPAGERVLVFVPSLRVPVLFGRFMGEYSDVPLPPHPTHWAPSGATEVACPDGRVCVLKESGSWRLKP